MSMVIRTHVYLTDNPGMSRAHCNYHLLVCEHSRNEIYTIQWQQIQDDFYLILSDRTSVCNKIIW